MRTLPETHAEPERVGDSDGLIVAEPVAAGAEGEGDVETLGVGEKDMQPDSTTAPAPPRVTGVPAFAYVKPLIKAFKLALTKLLPPPPP